MKKYFIARTPGEISYTLKVCYRRVFDTGVRNIERANYI
jgi:hypothetical protein